MGLVAEDLGAVCRDPSPCTLADWSGCLCLLWIHYGDLRLLTLPCLTEMLSSPAPGLFHVWGKFLGSKTALQNYLH